MRRTLCALPRSLCRCASIILLGDDAFLLTLLRNVVAYACRHSREEDRRHAHRSAFFGCPSTGDQGFSHQRFSSAQRDNGNCGNRTSPSPTIETVATVARAPGRVELRPGASPVLPSAEQGPGVRPEKPLFIGGAKRDRTVDLYNAIVALSQLSYGPGTSGTARDIIPAPLTGNRGTGNSA